MTKPLTIILALLFCVLQYELWFSDGGVTSFLDLKKHVQEQIVTNTKIAARNLTLKSEIFDLKNGHQAIEDRARNELGMIKSGEIFYQVIQH